jgi:hypothetical protein
MIVSATIFLLHWRSYLQDGYRGAAKSARLAVVGRAL